MINNEKDNYNRIVGRSGCMHYIKCTRDNENERLI